MHRLFQPRFIRELLEDVGFVEIQRAEVPITLRGQLFIDSLADLFIEPLNFSSFRDSKLTFVHSARRPSPTSQPFAPPKELLDATRDLVLSRDYGEATLQHAREALLASPLHAEAHSLYALVSEQHLRHGLSLRHFYAAHLLDPSSHARKTNVYNALQASATYFLHLHRYSHALYHLFLLAELWPADLAVWSAIAEAHDQLGQTSSALRITESILAANRSYLPGLDSGVFEMYDQLHQHDKSLILALDVLNSTQLDPPGVLMAMVYAYRSCIQLVIWSNEVCENLRFQAFEKLKAHLSLPDSHLFPYVFPAVRASDLLDLGLTYSDIAKILREIYLRIDLDPEAAQLRRHFWKQRFPNVTQITEAQDPFAHLPLPLSLKTEFPLRSIADLRIGLLFDPDNHWSVEWAAALFSQLPGPREHRLCFALSSRRSNVVHSSDYLYQIDALRSHCVSVDLNRHDTAGRVFHLLHSQLHVLLDALSITNAATSMKLLAARVAPLQVSVLGSEVVTENSITPLSLSQAKQLPFSSTNPQYLNPLFVNRHPELARELRLLDADDTFPAFPSQFTIGYFAPTSELTPLSLNTLLKTMHRLPFSRLILLEPPMLLSKQNFLRVAAQSNISALRFLWLPQPMSLSTLMRHRAEISCIWTHRGLSALPTVVHALWAGIPVIHRHTGSHYSSFITSMLELVGLSDNARRSSRSMEEFTTGLAQSPKTMIRMRNILIRSRNTSALWNPALGATVFQDFITTQWQNAMQHRGFDHSAPLMVYPEQELVKASRLSHWKDRWVRDASEPSSTFVSLRDAQDDPANRMTKAKLNHFEASLKSIVHEPPFPDYVIPESRFDITGLYLSRISILPQCKHHLAYRLTPNGLPVPSATPLVEAGPKSHATVELSSYLLQMHAKCVAPTLPAIDLEYDENDLATPVPIPSFDDVVCDSQLDPSSHGDSVVDTILNEYEKRHAAGLEDTLYYANRHDMFPPQDGDPLAALSVPGDDTLIFISDARNEEASWPADSPIRSSSGDPNHPSAASSASPKAASSTTSAAPTNPFHGINPDELSLRSQPFPSSELLDQLSLDQFQAAIQMMVRHWDSVSSRTLGPITSHIASWYHNMASISFRWVTFHIMKLEQLEAEHLTAFNQFLQVMNQSIMNPRQVHSRELYPSTIKQVSPRMSDLLNSCRFMKRLLLHMLSQQDIISAIVRKFVAHATHVDRLHHWMQSLKGLELLPLNVTGIMYTFRGLDKMKMMHDMERATLESNSVYAQHILSMLESIQLEIRKTYQKLTHRFKDFVLTEKWDSTPYGNMLVPKDITDYDNPTQLFPWYPALLEVVDDRARTIVSRWHSVYTHQEHQLALFASQIQHHIDIDEILKASVSCSESALSVIGTIEGLSMPLLLHLAQEQVKRPESISAGFSEFNRIRHQAIVAQKSLVESKSAHCTALIQNTLPQLVPPLSIPSHLQHPDFWAERKSDHAFLQQIQNQLRNAYNEVSNRIENHEAKIAKESEAVVEFESFRKALHRMRQFANKAQVSMQVEADLTVHKLQLLLNAASAEKDNLNRISLKLQGRLDPSEFEMYATTLDTLISTLSVKIQDYQSSQLPTVDLFSGLGPIGGRDDDDPKIVYTGGHAIPSWITKTSPTLYTQPQNQNIDASDDN